MINKTLISSAVQACRINTGDYIDPTPWTPEDHERFKKAMERVRELDAQQAACEVLNSRQVAAMRRELDLIDKSAAEKVNK